MHRSGTPQSSGLHNRSRQRCWNSYSLKSTPSCCWFVNSSNPPCLCLCNPQSLKVWCCYWASVHVYEYWLCAPSPPVSDSEERTKCCIIYFCSKCQVFPKKIILFAIFIYSFNYTFLFFKIYLFEKLSETDKKGWRIDKVSSADSHSKITQRSELGWATQELRILSGCLT